MNYMYDILECLKLLIVCAHFELIEQHVLKCLKSLTTFQTRWTICIIAYNVWNCPRHNTLGTTKPKSVQMATN